MDGLSGKNFSCGVVFPDNKAFRKLCFARCLIENMVTLFYQTAIDHVYFYEIEFAKLIIHYRKMPLPTYQYRRFFDLPKMGDRVGGISLNLRNSDLSHHRAYRSVHGGSINLTSNTPFGVVI